MNFSPVDITTATVALTALSRKGDSGVRPPIRATIHGFGPKISRLGWGGVIFIRARYMGGQLKPPKLSKLKSLGLQHCVSAIFDGFEGEWRGGGELITYDAERLEPLGRLYRQRFQTGKI